MAAPVIDSVTPTSVTLPPVSGSTADVVIVAHDPDAAAGSGVVNLTDLEGNVTPVVVALQVDQLNFEDQGTDLPNVTSQVVDVQPTQITVRYTVL